MLPKIQYYSQKYTNKVEHQEGSQDKELLEAGELRAKDVEMYIQWGQCSPSKSVDLSFI